MESIGKDLQNGISKTIDGVKASSGKIGSFKSFRDDLASALKSLIRNSRDSANKTPGKDLVYFQVLIYGILMPGVPLPLCLLVKMSSVAAFGGGLLVAGKSLLQLREQNSLFLAPSQNHQLKTDGMYQYVRHPMYGGILATCLGHAVLCNSVDRLLLTAALALVLVSGVLRCVNVILLYQQFLTSHVSE